MLVLTRKVEETIQIGPDVTVTVLRIKGRSVQIGIEAPTGVLVLRGELGVDGERRREAEGVQKKPTAGKSSRRTPRVPEPSHEEPEAEGHRRAPHPVHSAEGLCRGGAGDLPKAVLSHC